MYIEDIENNYLQNEIDYSTFNQQEFDNVKICKYCDCEFNHPYFLIEDLTIVKNYKFLQIINFS